MSLPSLTSAHIMSLSLRRCEWTVPDLPKGVLCSGTALLGVRLSSTWREALLGSLKVGISWLSSVTFQLWRRERPAEALAGDAGDTGEGDAEVCIEAEVDIARLWLREWDMLRGHRGMSPEKCISKRCMYKLCCCVTQRCYHNFFTSGADIYSQLHRPAAMHPTPPLSLMYPPMPPIHT